MKGIRLVLLTAFCLWMAGGCQEALAPRLAMAGAAPDFGLVTIAVIGLTASRRSAAVIGFFAGLMQGAIAGANLGPYIMTRTLAGFLCGMIASLEFEPTMVVAGLLAVGVTLVAQIGLMFVAPPNAIVPFLLATIGSAVVNGVLAMPYHALIRRFAVPAHH